MPRFDLLDKVELFVRTGTFVADASKSSKKVTKAASKHFTYKDGSLWRTYRGRLLQVVRSDEEVREILTRYHDNNNHAGRERAVREIMLMYYWVGVTNAVKDWIKACTFCKKRNFAGPHEPPVQFCLAVGCDSSSYTHPELSFHRFPKEVERRQRWLVVAQRDIGSLRSNSYLCSRHFDSSCFTSTEEGQLTPDAVPTIILETPQEEVVPSDEDFLHSNMPEDLLSSAAGAAETPELSFDTSEAPVELQEHRFSLPASDPDCRAVQTTRDCKKQETVVEPSFRIYNQIARYLSHRVIAMPSKISRGSLRRMSKRFSLKDGVLMYTQVSTPLRVPRSREEVNSILQQFHDNQGHYGQGICQREIFKHFYWATMTRDVARWIASCQVCLNRTKRKWLRCSVINCTNCCGPVERGLGLTFHKFPLHNAALLAQWLVVVGRPHWHPRLRSSVCSAHFTEDCFYRSGDKIALHPDAVPSLSVPGHSASQSGTLSQPAAGVEVYFAKYDAVEHYLCRHTYPPGLNYVEKNTFRRFCKKFVIKDNELHIVKGERACLVLRSREQVEAALLDFHNELNHLNVNKCLKLLSERYFWKTMRSDVVQWISSCSHCSRAKWKMSKNLTEARGAETQPKAQGSSQMHRVSDSEAGDADGKDGDEGRGSGDDTEELSVLNSEDTVLQEEVSSSNPEPQEHHRVIIQDMNKPLMGPAAKQQTQQRPKQTEVTSKSQTPKRPRNHSAGPHLLKRRRDPEADPSTKRSRGLDPVVAPSTKPWPVFTIAGSLPAQEAPPPSELDSSSTSCRRLQARTIIQQCSYAKVKTRPALDGADAQWAEIQEGMVVYVCFFQGATEDVTYQIASRLLTIKLFQKDTRHTVSVLDLPGSVLLVPQDSLLGEPVSQMKMHYKGGCELWMGAQLLSKLASACRQIMSESPKCTKGGVKVEQGVCGQKQEIVLKSLEPMTVLLEF